MSQKDDSEHSRGDSRGDSTGGSPGKSPDKKDKTRGQSQGTSTGKSAETSTEQSTGQGGGPRSDAATRTEPAQGEPGAGTSSDETGGAGEPPTEAPPRPRAGWPGAVALIALVLVLVVAGALGVGVYYFDRELRERTAQQSETLTELRQRLESQASRIEALDSQVSQRADALERRQQALRDAIQRLREEAGQDRAGWALAEVEYLLRIANQRLTLARDVGTAKAALTAADARLQALADPGLVPVRERIRKEITALENVPDPDVTGMALTLASLEDHVADWPLVGAHRPEASAPGTGEGAATRDVQGWRGFAQSVWSDLKGLVRVRRHDEPVEPMLAPEHAYFIRQNMRLKLEAARLALLQGEGDLYREQLATARGWLEAFFDTERTGPANAVGTLEELGEADIRPELPDISGSLRKLRSVALKLDSDAGGSGATKASGNGEAGESGQ